MNQNSEWDYWPGIDDEISSFYEDHNQNAASFSGAPNPNNLRPPKRRRVGGEHGEPPSPPTQNFNSAFSSPQMGPWPSPQLGPNTAHFFSPKMIGSPTSASHPVVYPQEIPPMVLSGLPPMDPNHPMPPYPFQYMARPMDDPFGRGPYDQHGRSMLTEDAPQILLPDSVTYHHDPRLPMYDPTKNPYEELKRQMLFTLAYEIQTHNSTLESHDPNHELPPVPQLDINTLSSLLETRDYDDDKTPLASLSMNLLAPGAKMRPKENMSRAERITRLENAMGELNFIVERVLNPLIEFVNARDEILQHQSQYYRQLIKQIRELQPHYEDLSRNFETLCQHLKRRPRPPKSLIEKRDDSK
jgi:hypothetical protein